MVPGHFGIKMELLERMLIILTILRWDLPQFTTKMVQSKNLKSLEILSHSYDKKNFIIMNLFCLNKWTGKIRNIDTKNFLWVKKSGPFPDKFLDGGLLILKRLENRYYKL